MIKVEDCKPGWLYWVSCRNAECGIFSPHHDNGFIINREKFGNRFTFVEYHYENGPPFGTASPIEALEEAPDFGFDLQDLYKATNEQDQKLLAYLLEAEERFDIAFKRDKRYAKGYLERAKDKGNFKPYGRDIFSSDDGYEWYIEELEKLKNA